jgi:23S rRNA pseudouridine2605 synthase
MLEAVGYRVVHLIRTGFGVLELGDLKIGHYRFLKSEEIEDMKKMVGL